MLSRKHYKAIANVIDSLQVKHGLVRKDSLITALANYFERDNPRFDYPKFNSACYERLGEREC